MAVFMLQFLIIESVRYSLHEVVKISMHVIEGFPLYCNVLSVSSLKQNNQSTKNQCVFLLFNLSGS